MIKKLNHEIQYENILKQINEDFETGKITAERKDTLISMATVEESAIRKKEVDDDNIIFNTKNCKESDSLYYSQLITQYCEELYIKCIYSFNDNFVAVVDNLGGCLCKLEITHSLNEMRDIEKKIYNDLINNKLDLLHTSSNELCKLYALR